jgi:channel protein (hemolysin III family)
VRSHAERGNEVNQVTSVIPIPGFADPFSSLSHLAGAIIFAVLSVPMLLRARGQTDRVVSLAIFCISAVSLLSISGVYHLLEPNGDAREVLRRLDHAAIFVLIAATFTPVHVLLFRGWGKWGFLALIWTYAVVAIAVKTIYFHQIPKLLSLSLYLGMGWIGLYTCVSLWRRYGFEFIRPILWGGVAYSVGAVLEALRWPVIVPGVIQWHEIFHVAVLIGLTFHWAFNYQIADGSVPPRR